MKIRRILVFSLLLALLLLPSALGEISEAWSPMYTVDPTCTEQGYTVYENFFMPGTLENRDFVPALGHDMGPWEPLRGQVATCTQMGVDIRYCARCGASEMRNVPTTGHSWGPWQEYPDCENESMRQRQCQTCGEWESETVPPLGHSWDGGAVTTAPTCTAEGVKTFTCSRCGKTRTEAIPAAGHTPESLPAAAATCTEPGHTEGSKCAVCGAILTAPQDTPALGHDWQKSAVTTKPTCTTEGVRTWYCGNDPSHTKTEKIPVADHTPESIPAVAATCTAGGKTEGSKCAVCGAILTAPQDTPALGHDWQKSAVTTAPTCTTEGVWTWYCGNDTSHTKTESIPATGHSPVSLPAIAATCTEPGKTEGSKCSLCGEILTEQKETAALGHAWDNGRVTREAACEAEGERTFACGRCGEIRTEEIPAAGHTYEDIPGVEATCTEPGSTPGIRCAVCGTVLDRPQTIPALGHTWSEWIIDVKETCVLSGEQHQVCLRCGEEKGIAIQPLGHDWDDGAMTKEPGVLNPGEITYTCLRCGETEIEAIPTKNGVESVFRALTPDLPDFDVSSVLKTLDEPVQAEPDDSPLHIVKQPEGGTVEPGGVMSLTVKASGGAPFGYFYGSPTYTYQWYRSPSDAEKQALAGLYNLLLWLLGVDADIAPDDFGDTEVSTWQSLYDVRPGSYYCAVTDAEGETVTSEKAEVREQMYILRQPENVNARTNKNWSVSVSAAGGTEPYQYKWFYCRNFGAEGSSSYFRAENATGHVLNREDTDYVSNEFSVYCVISDANGDSVQSDIAEIYYTKPIIVFVNDEAINTPGGSVTLTALIDGGRKPFVFQWYGPEGEIPEATERSVDISKGGRYYVTVTDAWGDSATSAPAIVTMKPLTIARHPEGGELPRGGGQHKLEVIVEDGNAPFWYVLYDAESGFMCDFSPNLDTGESSRIYDFIVEYPGKYYITVRDQDGREARTNPVYVTAYKMLELEDYTREASVSSAEDYTELAVTVRNGTKPYTYHWQRWVSDYPASSYMYWNSGRYEDMPDANMHVINAERGRYLCTVTDAAGDEVYTPPIPVNYTGKEPIIIQQPENVELEYNAYWYPSASLRVDAISASGGDIAYSWRKKTASGWSVVGSGKTLYLSESAVTTEYDAITGTYRCLVTDKTTGGYVYSQEASVTMPMTIRAYQEGTSTTVVVEVEGGVAPYNMVALRSRYCKPAYTMDVVYLHEADDYMLSIADKTTVVSGPHDVEYTMSVDRYAKDKVHAWGWEYETYKFAWTYTFYVTDSTGQKISAKVTCEY